LRRVERSVHAEPVLDVLEVEAEYYHAENVADAEVVWERYLRVWSSGVLVE
jgi:hypothetical protein